MPHLSTQLAALLTLHRHPQWPHRACVRTDAVGEPLLTSQGVRITTELFYATDAKQQRAASKVCTTSCPLVDACRDYALGGDGWWESEGVWGGLTAKERESIRRAQTKRRSRQARQPRPVAVLNWQPTDKQRELVRALARKNDLRAAAESLGSTYASVRWMHARMCRNLGFFPDELTIGQFVAAATNRMADTKKPARRRMADAA
ncbi:WhiB family transcriptional regulator [Streptomyces ipomoeae]|uniref:WhiB family transcriptional regulator n=1 Tax=Streptomyces ipomoeae TaxID=103232 RepID=UPI0015F10593|nr:WhiB family transcriptional regulator [Streptomyces ipomoeae]